MWGCINLNTNIMNLTDIFVVTNMVILFSFLSNSNSQAKRTWALRAELIIGLISGHQPPSCPESAGGSLCHLHPLLPGHIRDTYIPYL